MGSVMSLVALWFGCVEFRIFVVVFWRHLKKNIWNSTRPNRWATKDINYILGLIIYSAKQWHFFGISKFKHMKFNAVWNVVCSFLLAVIINKITLWINQINDYGMIYNIISIFIVLRSCTEINAVGFTSFFDLICWPS